MENPETARLVAKSKMKLSATALGLLILFGLAVDYGRENAPLDEATVVFVRGRAEAKAAAPAAAEPVADEAKPAAEVTVGEFLGYLQEVSDKVNAVSKPESALGQIVLPKAAAEPAVERAVFKEPVIEVTDDNGEVVNLLEATSEAAKPETVAAVVEQAVENEAAGQDGTVETQAVELMAETSVKESAPVELTPSEPVVNADENMLSDEENGEAVDMMKEIMQREQTANTEN